MSTQGIIHKALVAFQVVLLCVIGYFTYLYAEMLFIAILSYLTVVSLHELGHLWVARFYGVTVTDFSIGLGTKFNFYTSKRTGIRYHISMLPLGGYVSMLSAPPQEDSQEALEGDVGYISDAVREKQGLVYLKEIHPFKRIQVMIAGVVMNALTALAMFVSIFMFLGIDNLDTYVFKASETSELQAGDHITAVNGTNVSYLSDAYEIMNANKGEVLELTVTREGETLVVKQPTGVNQEGNVDLGFKFDGQYHKVQFYNFGDAVARSYDFSKLMLTSMFEKIGEVITGKEEYHKVFNGPVGITNGAGQLLEMHEERADRRNTYGDESVQGESSVTTFIWAFIDFAARISIAIALVNILPIPVVDGGHIVLAAAEWIKGSPVSEKSLKFYAVVGLIAIACLYGLGLSSDYVNFLS